jgi:hypothetical protein
MRVVPAVLLASLACEGATPRAVRRSVPESNLAAPLSALSTKSFSRVVGIVEAGLDTVFVADELERSLELVDLVNDRSRIVGRNGNGPTEYTRPRALYRFRGDSVLMYDVGQRRFLVVSGDGHPTRVFRPKNGLLGTVVGADTVGSIYLVLTPSFGPAGRLSGDSATVVRWNPDLATLDTLVWIKEAPASTQVRQRAQGGGTDVLVSSFPVPFGPADDLAVGPDGGLAVARVSPFRLEWWLNGRRQHSGEALPTDSVPITALDRRPYEQRSSPVSFRWPAYKPPFLRGALLLSRDGDQAWLRRTNGTDSDTTLYDVFDRRGIPIWRVRVVGNRRVVGLGQRNVYVMRRDTTDLLFLEAYRNPVAR